MKNYTLDTSKFETVALHAGQEEPENWSGARQVPIVQSSSFVFKDCEQAAGRFGLTDSGNIYARLTNPTQDVFEQRISALCGGVGALAFASGMAAITAAIQGLAHAGDHVVCANNVYGGTLSLLENTLSDFGITTTFVDPKDPQNFENAIKDNTKLLYIESLGNPNSDITDIEAVAKIAHSHDIVLVVDNTFATPFLIRPIEFGADVVVHSATKFIGGHGAAVGGVVVDAGNFDFEKSGKYPWLVEENEAYHGVSFTRDCGRAAYITSLRALLIRDTGATLSPFHAFLFIQGLETLSLRVERHTENALKVVEFLKNHPKVKAVHHPSVGDESQRALYKKYLKNGGGSIFTFEIDGDENTAKKFIDSTELFSLLANVADVKSLIIHPATTTHAQLSDKELNEAGIKRNTIRLSIGTEHIDDILADLENAFSKV